VGQLNDLPSRNSRNSNSPRSGSGSRPASQSSGSTSPSCILGDYQPSSSVVFVGASTETQSHSQRFLNHDRITDHRTSLLVPRSRRHLPLWRPPCRALPSITGRSSRSSHPPGVGSPPRSRDRGSPTRSRLRWFASGNRWIPRRPTNSISEQPGPSLRMFTQRTIDTAHTRQGGSQPGDR
jgi:hypothetical protein